jgi:hypothetical protein
MRSTNFDKVSDFQQEVLKRQFPNGPTLPADPIHEIRCLTEELYELNTGLMTHDLVEAADAIVDLIYFAYGLGFQMGLPMDALFNIVHEANMKKVRGMTKRGNPNDASKPEGWKDPKESIKELLGL